MMGLNVRVRAEVFNGPTAAPGADILAESVSTGDEASAFRLTVILGANASFRAIVSDGVNSHEAAFNSGMPLVADALYTFTIGVHRGLRYNFRVGASAAVKLLLVDEIYGGVI